VEKMLIPAKPRKVKRSAEFTCPASFETALNEFVSKVENGELLTPYLSTKITDSTSKTLLLYDWNIHHFSLTRRPDRNNNNFMSRSPYQVFAMVTDEFLYMIQVYEHPDPEKLGNSSKTPKNPFGYSKQEMISIVYRNWPELIEGYKLQGSAYLEHPITDEDYSELRKAGVSAFADIGDGNVFTLIGGGYMADGTSGDAVNQADHWHNLMSICQHNIVNNVRQILDDIEELLGRKAEPNLQISLLLIEDGNVLLAEKTNGVIIEIEKNKARMRCILPQHLLEIKL